MNPSVLSPSVLLSPNVLLSPSVPSRCVRDPRPVRIWVARRDRRSPAAIVRRLLVPMLLVARGRWPSTKRRRAPSPARASVSIRRVVGRTPAVGVWVLEESASAISR